MNKSESNLVSSKASSGLHWLVQYWRTIWWNLGRLALCHVGIILNIYSYNIFLFPILNVLLSCRIWKCEKLQRCSFTQCKNQKKIFKGATTDGELAEISVLNYKLPTLKIRFAHSSCPVGWGCRIHQLHLCRGLRPPLNESPEYDTKQSDGEVSVMLELWGMRSTTLLPLLSGPLWPGVVAPNMGPIYGLNRIKLCFFHYIDFCI